MRGITAIVARALTAALIILLLFACGHGQRASFAPSLDAAKPTAPVAQPEITWPEALPADALQPWEETDGSGRIVSSINLDSQFVPGVERFSEAGDVADLGEASSFTSGASGAEAVSYALYRVPLGAEQPGTIAADVNLHAGGAYWLGVADYSANTWRWHGPFAAPHVRVSLPHYEYTSTLGNLFVAVVAYDGAAFDLVGLGVNARDDADSSAPEAPSVPTLTPVAGGLHVRWLKVDEEDLAGYRLYADGKEALNYVEGGTSVVIAAAAETEITLTAIDLSGNESDPSEASTDSPLAGAMPQVELTASAASGGRNAVIELTASGAETYDWDVDGDGNYDITGDATGAATASTASFGIIRPALRGHTADGGFSLSAVSLIIAGNSRPVAVAYADPASGYAPLSVSFTGSGEDEDGTIAAYAWDFDGNGIYDSASQNPPPHTYTIAGMYNAKFRVTDNEGAWDVDTVGINALPDPTNIPPVADLTVTPDEVILGIGDTPPDVTMDGSASTDPEGGPLEFSFDFYGDNSFSSYQSDPTYMDFYPNPGKYEPTLRVRDEGGLVSEISRFVNVYRFSSMVVDDTSFTGEYTSIFDLNGFPSIFYYDADFGDLRFVRAGYKDGSYWDEPETVDGKGADVGRFASVAVVNGRPAIAYYDATRSDLKYVRAENATGTSWGTPRVLDTAGSVGTGASLAVVNGNPAVSYFDNSNNNLKFVRANDADGASWGTPMTVDSKNGTGDYNSLAVVNGNPAIAYNDWGDGDLRYIQATDANGTSWGTPVVVESATEGRYCSMAVVNGNPAVSYYGGVSDLMCVRATDANGSAWGAPVPVDTVGSTGRYTSLKVVNGNPAISYQYSTASDLYYVRATNANGTAWGAPVAVDTVGVVGPYTSLYVVNGNPAISYYDETNFDLKYVRATNADGSAWAAPVTAYSTGIVGQYTSMTVAAGNPVIANFDVTQTRLLLARSTDADGTAWNSYVADPGDYNFGEYASGAAVGGHPAVAYCDSWNGDLRFCRASDEAGTSWGYSVILDSEGNVGDYASLAIVASNPAVAYQDTSNMYLKYVRATDSTGTNWGSPIVVDNGAGNAVGQYSSLAVVNGNPAISYIDSSDYDLLYIRATDSAGATWGTRVIVVSDEDVGEYSSMAVINGTPAIAYADTTNDQLEFVMANDANGGTWGAPVVVVDGVSTGDIVRLGERDGRPVIIYRDSLDDDLCYVEALNPSGTVWKQLKKVDTKGYVGEYASFIVTKEGLPLIAYHDSDGYLKFATLRLY